MGIVRIDDDLHDSVKEIAKTEDIGISKIINMMIFGALNEIEFKSINYDYLYMQIRKSGIKGIKPKEVEN